MIIFSQYGIANPAGGSAGASVSVNVTVSYNPGTSDNDYAGLSVPLIPPSPVGALAKATPNYFVSVNPSQPATWTVSAKSGSGFTVTLTPVNGATLAAGTFDVAAFA